MPVRWWMSLCSVVLAAAGCTPTVGRGARTAPVPAERDGAPAVADEVRAVSPQLALSARDRPSPRFTNRGFSVGELRAEGPFVRWTELPSDEGLAAAARQVHGRLREVLACFAASAPASGEHASRHARFVGRAGRIAVETSPPDDALARCLERATEHVAAGHDGASLGQLTLVSGSYATTLPVAPSSAALVRGFGGCFFFDRQDCGVDQDCPMDGLRPALCPSDAGAVLSFVLEGDGTRREAHSVEVASASGEPLYLAPLPFAVSVATSPNERSPSVGIEASGLAFAMADGVVGVVADEGAFALRIADGAVRFAFAPRAGARTRAWDTARGEVRVRRVRCPFEGATAGRLAVRCADRIVLVWGGEQVVVLDVHGTELARAEGMVVDATSVGMSPSLDLRVGEVTVRVRGRRALL